jgi:hypothetical protein
VRKVETTIRITMVHNAGQMLVAQPAPAGLSQRVRCAVFREDHNGHRKHFPYLANASAIAFTGWQIFARLDPFASDTARVAWPRGVSDARLVS